MTQNKLDEALDRAARIVASWPDWKRGLLEQSARQTRSQPREQVNSRVLQAARQAEKDKNPPDR